MTQPFAPCPFCAGTLVTIRVHLANRLGEVDNVHAECKTCLATGPAYKIEAKVHRPQSELNEAVRHVTRLWNERR